MRRSCRRSTAARTRSSATSSAALTACSALAICAAPAAARPGPDLLYAKPAVAPQLTNTRHLARPADPVSGATRLPPGRVPLPGLPVRRPRRARGAPTPTDPRATGDTFSKPNGTYTYPTGRALRQRRRRPGRVPRQAAGRRDRASASRSTRSKDPTLIAFSIALGGRPGQPHAFPFGANVRRPADAVPDRAPGSGSRARRRRSPTRPRGTPVAGPAPTVTRRHDAPPDRGRRPPPALEPAPARPCAWRWASGCGTRDQGRYLLPRPTAAATAPGRRRPAAAPGGVLQRRLPHRTSRCRRRPRDAAAVTDAGLVARSHQGAALAAGDISRFYANVNFAKLAARRHRQLAASRRPGRWTGSWPATSSSRQGADFASECASQRPTNRRPACPSTRAACSPTRSTCPQKPRAGRRLRHDAAAALAVGQLQPVPRHAQPVAVRRPRRRLDRDHARGARPRRVLRGLRRGRRVRGVGRRRAPLSRSTRPTATSPATRWAASARSSSARSSPTCSRAPSRRSAFETNNDVARLAAQRAGADVEHLGRRARQRRAVRRRRRAKLAALGYRYELDVVPAVRATRPAARCSPTTSSSRSTTSSRRRPRSSARPTVDRNPSHVTYVVDTARDHPASARRRPRLLGLGPDHPRRPHNGTTGDPRARSTPSRTGFGAATPSQLAPPGRHRNPDRRQPRPAPTRTSRSWGAAPPAPTPTRSTSTRPTSPPRRSTPRAPTSTATRRSTSRPTGRSRSRSPAATGR